MSDESKEEQPASEPMEFQKKDIHSVLMDLSRNKRPGERKFVDLTGKVNWGGMFVVGTGPDSGQPEGTQPGETNDYD